MADTDGGHTRKKGMYGEGHTRKEDLFKQGIYTETYLEKGRHTQEGAYAKTYTKKGQPQWHIGGEDIHGERTYKERGHIRSSVRNHRSWIELTGMTSGRFSCIYALLVIFMISFVICFLPLDIFPFSSSDTLWFSLSWENDVRHDGVEGMGFIVFPVCIHDIDIYFFSAVCDCRSEIIKVIVHKISHSIKPWTQHSNFVPLIHDVRSFMNIILMR